MTLDSFNATLDAVRRAREREVGATVVTIVSNSSERSFRPSQRMVVFEDGSTVGSIDPELDAQLLRDALEALNTDRTRLRSYTITDSQLQPAGTQKGCIDIYFEVLSRSPRLVIVGGGHIAVPLVEVAKLLEFDVTVLDDRLEYAMPGRFPRADKVIHGPYRETLAGIRVDRRTYIVLVTRGHVHDQACLEQVIDSPAAYIGMIGSKRRVRTVMEHMATEGYDPAKLRTVHAPIGLDIGSKTPPEIAVAIGAELVNVRRGGRAPSLALGERRHA